MLETTPNSEKLVTLGGESTRLHPLFGFDLAALTQICAEMGERPYRAKQLADALYRQRVTHLDQITTLPQALRDRLMAAPITGARRRTVLPFDTEAVDELHRHSRRRTGPRYDPHTSR